MAAEVAVSTAALKLADLLTQKANFLRGSIVGEVEQLRDELKGVLCFLRDAEGKQADDVAVRDWISETREVAHDAEDVVEVFMFKVERGRVMLASFASSLNHKYRLKRFGGSIKSIRKRLCGIEGQRLSLGIRDLGNRPIDGVEPSKSLRRLPQWQKDKHVVGMEEDVELLLEKAILDESKELTFSAIVGMGGTGKSTLARIVHNHPVVAEQFERRAFVVVSKDRRPRDILKELYVQVKSSETMEWEMSILEELELSELQERLYKEVKGKRYFVVVEGMWEDDQVFDAIGGAFADEGTGSRFLLTLRTPLSEDEDGYVHTMKCLDSDKSWTLFLNTVSDGKGLEDLEDLGRQIVNKCNGIPLAITVIGGLLLKQRRSKGGWEKVLEEMNSHLNRNNNDTIQAVLELSYQDLSPKLKACFLCFGFFRENGTIITRKLVDIWISEGFIPQEDGKTKEEIAMAYLEELIDRNMVQIKDVFIDDHIKSCVVHDLLRDLSIQKAEEEIKLEILTNEESKHESSKRPHHRILDCGQGRFNDSIYGNKHVRTLVVHGAQPFLFTMSFSSYWMSFQLLRVLDFEGCTSMKQLPISIAALVGLRFLSLRNSGVEFLPNWLPRLINLEVLDMRGLKNMDLSEVFGKMRSLRRLYASSFYFEKPPEISGLKFLETLCYVNFNDVDINILTSMTSLSTLGINMFRIEDSEWLFMLLGRMENLVHLKLRYCKKLNLDMLGGLRRVTRLKLDGEITSLPSKFPPNVSCLSLTSSQLKEDPMLILQKLPKLLHLELDWAYAGTEIAILHDGFPELKVLCLCRLFSLRSMKVEEGAMPELRRMEIIRCLALESLPEEMRGMRNLEELKIVSSTKLATKLQGEDSHMISDVPYVQII